MQFSASFGIFVLLVVFSIGYVGADTCPVCPDCTTDISKAEEKECAGADPTCKQVITYDDAKAATKQVLSCATTAECTSSSVEEIEAKAKGVVTKCTPAKKTAAPTTAATTDAATTNATAATTAKIEVSTKSGAISSMTTNLALVAMGMMVSSMLLL